LPAHVMVTGKLLAETRSHCHRIHFSQLGRLVGTNSLIWSAAPAKSALSAVADLKLSELEFVQMAFE